MRHVTRTALAAILLATAVARAAAQDADPRLRQVDSAFSEWNRPGSPGLAVAVVRNGGVLLERGYGYANLEHAVPITPATVFDVASVSKQFAGLAIAMLVEQGRIRVDDDVRKYLPELADFGHTITIGHLLHHTSGLRDWPGTLAIAGWRYDDVISYDQILRMAFSQRTLNFVPGAEYEYSNTGYNVLAEVVARVGGKPFRAWTDEHLFRPLGMTSTHFHDDHSMVVPRRAYGYARTRDGWRAVTNNLTALGSSSLFSTVQDMSKWLANFDDGRGGGRAAVARMRDTAALNDGSPNAYAFGLSLGTNRGQPTLSHSGSWAGFVSYLLYYPRQRFGVIVLANTSAVSPQRAAFTLTDLFIGDELDAMSSELTAQGSQPADQSSGLRAQGEQSDASVAPEVLDRYAGIYRLGPGWYVRIRRDGGVLRTQATREGEFPLSPRSSTTFWVEAYNAEMTFAPDSATGVMTMRYRGRQIPRLAREASPRPGNLSELAGTYVSDELGTFYTVVVKDTSAMLRHWRRGDIPLTHAYGDDYTGPGVPSVEFQRDASGRVSGFLVNSGSRVRNVSFQKR